VSNARNVSTFEPHGSRELVRLVRRIQTLTADLDDIGRHAASPEVQAKEHTLEQLRWLLAAVARRTATDSLENAA